MILGAVQIALIRGQWCLHTVTLSVLCQRVSQFIIHGRGIVSCTSEMQSVVGWKIAMAGLQKRLRFSLEYQTFSLKSQHLLAVPAYWYMRHHIFHLYSEQEVTVVFSYIVAWYFFWQMFIF